MSAEEMPVLYQPPAERSSVILAPVMNIAEAKRRLHEFQEFCQGYLIESDPERGIDGDYGVIPGTKKKSLLKPGADKLCELYALYDQYELISSVEDWERGLFDYTFKCILKSRRDDSLAGTGVGSCSSWESKYRWRDSQRKCPTCGKENIRKSKEAGKGWYCWVKTGGCGATFKEGDPAIDKQVIGRVDNPDIVDQKNTVLKMAKKRAKIDAVIGVTRSSGIFTQDMEDLPAVNVAEPVRVSEPKTYMRASAAGNPPQGAVPDAPQKGRETNPAPQSAEPISPPPATIDGQQGGDVEAATRAPAAPASAPVEYIKIGAQKNFHIQCRAAVRPARSMDADNLTYQWLLDNGYVNEKGEPSAALIPAAGWLEIRERAIEWLKQQ